MATTGYEGASVASIARAASLSPGLVHYHFESKQEILVELFQELADGLQRRAERRAKSAPSPRRRLEAAFDAWLALGEDSDPEAVACWIGIASEAQRVPEVRDLYVGFLAEAIALLDELICRALDDERRSTANTRRIAVSLMATVEGYFQIAAGASSLVETGSAASSVQAIVNALLDAQPPCAGEAP